MFRALICPSSRVCDYVVVDCGFLCVDALPAVVEILGWQMSISVCFVEQKSIGMIFRTSRSGSDVRYSCHHNSSHFSFPIFAHSWRFSVFHSLQSITPRIY